MDANPQTKAKPTPVQAAPFFEFPKFPIPGFEMPLIGIPVMFREFVEKSSSQAKEHCERMRSASEAASRVFEQAYMISSKGASDLGLKVIEATQINTNAAFSFYGELLTKKSFSEMVELTTQQARKQFETLAAQSKDLTALAQKVTAESSEPIKGSVAKIFQKAA